MELQSFAYKQFEGDLNEWRVDHCSLGKINLIVGKNASGKSRTVNILGAISTQLSRLRSLSYTDGDYVLNFKDKRASVSYEISYEDQKVIREQFKRNKKILLYREASGEGVIYSKEIGKDLKFKVPEDELATIAKRDSFQHPFLESLYKWANDLFVFRFGTSVGKDQYVAFVQRNEKKIAPDIKNTEQVITKFKFGADLFGDEFVESIKKDMKKIDYQIEDIDIGEPLNVKFQQNLPASPNCFLVKEADLNEYIDQNDMSQGMFRTFSLIIQLNYAIFMEELKTLIIDDVGEGLDFSRASKLVKFLEKKSRRFKFQLIMTTNDKFIMNSVPLQYWTVIARRTNNPVYYNYFNSKEKFDKFELTGLSNFDLFSSNYFLKK